MTRLTGRFDGRAVVLDNPLDLAFPPETQLELFVVSMTRPDGLSEPSAEERQRVLSEFRRANAEFWQQQSPVPAPPAKRWTRDELYDEVV